MSDTNVRSAAWGGDPLVCCEATPPSIPTRPPPAIPTHPPLSTPHPPRSTRVQRARKFAFGERRGDAGGPRLVRALEEAAMHVVARSVHRCFHLSRLITSYALDPKLQTRVGGGHRADEGIEASAVPPPSLSLERFLQTLHPVQAALAQTSSH